MPLLSRLSLLAGLCLVLACPSKPTTTAQPDGGAPGAQPPPGQRPTPVPSTLAVGAAPGPLQRPPHPAMATSQYGFAALNALAATAPATTQPAPTAKGWALLASAQDGCEQDARVVFLQAYRAAAEDGAKAEAACGVLATLVMDPDPAGYAERLTDAYGIQLYASTAPGLSLPAEGARMLAMAAAGRDRDAASAAKRVADSDVKDPWARTLEGMTRSLLGDRGGALTAFNAALASGVSLPRTSVERAVVAFRLGDMGVAAADALTALKLSPQCTRCALTRASALALDDDPKKVSQGQQELVRLASSKLPGYWVAEAMAVASVVESRAGNTQAVEDLANRLKALKGFGAEASLASGLAAAASGQHGAAILALDNAARGLAPGPLRTQALRALAQSALAEGRHAQALEAIKGLDGEGGATPAGAALSARTLEAMKQGEAAREERLRAHALDPYDPVVAKEAGRPARPGGETNSARASQLWRLLAGGAPKEAMVLAKALADADKTNPYAAWAMMECQRGMDASTELGETPGKNVVVLAMDTVKRLGKAEPHAVFHGAARRSIILTLDEGDRPVVLDALKRFEKDPDPALVKLVQEGVARGGPRARRTADHGGH